MNCLVYGGAGFIGSYLSNELSKNHNVTVIDNEINGDKKRLNKSIKTINIDLDNYDYIFYLACSQISVSDNNVFEDVKNNSLNLLEILEYFKENPSTKLKKIIYTSSCSIFGNNNGTITEESNVDIKSIYASTKLLSENYCNLYFQNYGIPISIVRYSNVYGYNQKPPFVCGVVGKFINNAYNGIDLTIIDGNDTRDYVFIEDAVEATIVVAFSDSIGESFNLGTNTDTSINKIVEYISYYFNIKTNSIEKRLIDNVKKRKISFDKMNIKFGWKPKYNLEQGIKKIIDIEYKSNN